MNRPSDLPPLSNEAAPVYDKKIDRALERLGNFDGIPWFVIRWGQSKAATRYWAGELYFKYRDHVTRDLAWGIPRYDLAGQFKGEYERIYRREDLIPVDAMLDQVIIEKEIGIPRFFIEIAAWHDEEEWNMLRYTDEHGQIVLNDGKPVDFLGDYPRGGIDYEMMWLCAEHDGCCEDVSPTNNVGRVGGKRCFGHRRLPNMLDVQNIAARVRHFEKVKAEVNRQTDHEAAARATAQNTLDVEEYWRRFEAQIAEDNYQVLRPRLKRLTTEGHGMDLFEHNFVPSNYDDVMKADEVVTEE